MMIDIDQFMYELQEPLLDRTDVQIITADQKVPPGQLKDNRIVYNMILFANTDSRHTTIQKRNVVDSDDEDFEHDIEIENIMFPQATLSFTAFNDIMDAINEIRNWFFINGLGDFWLQDNDWNAVIRNVEEIENRTTYLESDYEQRYGFDVILEFKDVVKVTHDTIEAVEIVGPGGREHEINS